MWTTMMEEAKLTEDAPNEKLQELKNNTNPIVSQTMKITDAESLNHLSVKHYKTVSKALKKYVKNFGAEFQSGRTKRKAEIEKEANNEARGYDGDVRRVVDPITGMAA